MKTTGLKTAALVLSIVLAGSACSRGEPAAGASPGPGPAGATSMVAGDEAPAVDSVAAGQHRNLVRAGAGLYVAPEFCGMQYDAAGRARMREQQKEATVSRGHMSAAQFDAVFDAGIEDARKAFANASPAELEQTCAAVKAMQPGTPQG